MTKFRKATSWIVLLAGCGMTLFVPGHHVSAGVTSKVLQEAFEFMMRKFSKEVAEEGVERLASKMSALAARHSDDVVAQAFKRVGPRAGKLVSEAGEHGDDVLRLLARHGDAAIPLATRKTSLGLVKKFGQEAGEACVKHGSIADPIIEQFGETGAKALTKVSDRSGRQLAMLAGEGTLKPELLDIVTKYGDTACAFVWKNKGVLTGTAALAAFVASPEEFLNGTAQLTGTIVPSLAEAALKPIVTSAAESIPWTLVMGLLGAGSGLALAIWRFPHIVKWWLLCAAAKSATRINSSQERGES